MSQVFSYDRDAKTTEFFHFNESDGSVIIDTQQDITDILESNKAELGAHSEKSSTKWKGGWHKVMSIPLNILFELERLGITRDQKAMKKFINDPAVSGLRTKRGRV